MRLTHFQLQNISIVPSFEMAVVYEPNKANEQ